jgi:hypothetical protein
MRAGIVAKAAATFGKYIIFSKAELDPARDDWRVIGCWGENAVQALGELNIPVPGEQFAVTRGDGCLLLQLDTVGQQFEVWVDRASHPEHFEALQKNMAFAERDDWGALQIRAGTGRVEEATIEEFLPQMLNYDMTGHISFKKGCYTGQEIIARLHYRGKPKRRMYLASAPDDALFEAGTELFSQGSTQSVGTVVNSVRSAGQSLYLVTSTEGGIEKGLHPEHLDNPSLTIGELPYS